ncbi:MAG: BrnA antitoxin family protein [Nitrospirota bacterium]
MKKPLVNDKGEVRELTAEDFKKARHASEVLPGIVKAHRKGRGPQKTPTKVPTTVRLSREVVEYFKSKGKGWQSRMDEALKKYVRSHSPK